MELRVLQYFLAVAREQSISAAAQSLHLSQPTLSTQLKTMEQQLGKQLFIRGTKGSRKVTLTEEGKILQKRAEEILELVQKTENEILLADQLVAGRYLYRTGGNTGLPSVCQSCRTAAGKIPEYPLSSFQWKCDVCAGTAGQGTD